MSEKVEESIFVGLDETLRRSRMEWSAYASKYDAVCAYNPAYQENIRALVKRLPDWDLPDDANILDLGAGTGNFVCAMGKILPNASYLHVDCNADMNHRAREKYSDRKLNVSIVQDYLQRSVLPESSFDLIVCVNVLYAVAPQDLILRRMKRWLKPGAKLFIIDFGRQVEIIDWGLYLLKHVAEAYGIRHSIKALWENIEFAKQNRNAQKDFANGIFKQHSTQEFGQLLKSSGFKVNELATCYRDYCDLAVCTPER